MAVWPSDSKSQATTTLFTGWERERVREDWETRPRLEGRRLLVEENIKSSSSLPSLSVMLQCKLPGELARSEVQLKVALDLK